jgi:hypothetical protein
MTLEEFTSLEKELFFAPGFFVDIWKRNLTVAGVDAVNPGLAFRIKVALCCGTIRKLNLVGLARDWFARLIEEFDFHPVAGLRRGRTCRIR